jgi:hypothetical protein
MASQSAPRIESSKKFILHKNAPGLLSWGILVCTLYTTALKAR